MHVEERENKIGKEDKEGGGKKKIKTGVGMKEGIEG